MYRKNKRPIRPGPGLRLGVELVDRTARPISLTKYGQAVCDEGIQALASIEPIDAPPLPDANMILAWHENTPITTLFKDTILANQKALYAKQ